MLVLSKHILIQMHTAILLTKLRDERWKKVDLRTVLHSGACTDPGLMSWLRLDKRTKPCNYPSVSYDSKMCQGLWRKPNHWVLYFFQLYSLWAVRKKHSPVVIQSKKALSSVGYKVSCGLTIADGGRDSGRSTLSPSAWAVWPDLPLSRWS